MNADDHNAKTQAALLINRAASMLGQSQFEAARETAERALALTPDDARALNNLGLALNGLARPQEALAAFERALAVKPDHVSALVNRGVALMALSRSDEALQSFAAARALASTNAEAPYYLGLALARQNRRDEAIAAFDAALALAPGDPDALYSKAVALLAFGAYRDAWPLYEARWRAQRIRMSAPRDFGQKRWRGEMLSGVLRIWPEQGVGEELLFSALAALAPARVARVVLECDPRLAPLFKRTFSDIDVALDSSSAPADAQIAIGDLPGALALDGDPFAAAPRPRLVPDAARSAAARARYQALAAGKPVIGISWFSKNAEFGAQKSAALAEWGALLGRPALFVNLQYLADGEDKRAAERQFGCVIHDDPHIDQLRDLDALAAQIAALDHVVTVSNTTAHMAGALGAPCTVLLAAGAGRLGYWGAKGQTTPWYDSVRIERRALSESWGAAIARAAAAIPAFSSS